MSCGIGFSAPYFASFVRVSASKVPKRHSVTICPLSKSLRTDRVPFARAQLTEAQKEFVFKPSPFHAYRQSLSSCPKSEEKAAQKSVHEAQEAVRDVVAIEEDKLALDQNVQYNSHEDLISVLKELHGDPLEDEGGRVVLFRGSPAARLMIIGEAPGEMEDKMGIPFVGRGGELLDKIFTYGGFNTETQIYVTNAVKRRPRRNRTPTTTEIQYYKPYLLEEIRLINPAVIVLTGAVALQAMMGKTGISKLRGQWFGGGDDPWIMPVYHPAYLLRNPIRKHDMVEDIEEIRRKYMQVVPEELLQPLKRSS